MGLKDRLATRKRPSTAYALRVDDDTAARTALVTAQASGDPTRIAEAEAALDACYEQLTITALPPVELEELLKQHPPTDAQRAAGHTTFNPDTFVAALLAACIASDVSEAEWMEYTTKGAMTAGETNSLFNDAWDINYRVLDQNIKKG